MIPEELTLVNSWVSWRYEEIDGRIAKIPYNPITGKRVDSTNSSQAVSYAEVMNGNAHNYNGPGFLFTDTEYSFIDLDDPFKRSNGTYITDQDGEEFLAAQSVWNSHWQIVQEFNSYTEWSPSRRGIHIIVRGKLPLGSRNRVGKIEVYSEDRYSTMTGWHVDGTPSNIADRQGALTIFAEKLGLASPELSYKDQAATQEDQAIINAAGNGGTQELFRRLWMGDITGYPSGSEADQALANLICYQTPSVEQAERIFRLSPHYANRGKLHSRPELVRRVVIKGMDKRLPPIDMSAVKVATDYVRGKAREYKTDKAYINQVPEGLLG